MRPRRGASLAFSADIAPSRQLADKGCNVRLRLISDWLVYMVVRLFICMVQAMRIETCQVVCKGLAVLACDVVHVRCDVIDDNLKHAFPNLSGDQRRQIARRMWRHLFLMVCEIAQVPRKVHLTNWRQYVKVRGKRELVRYLLDTRPVILVSGHFGVFEIAGFTTGLLGFPSFSIARPLDNPFLHRFVNRFRGATGQFILPKQGSAQQVADVLDSGQTLGLLADQFAGPKGCWVEFFGRPASCHKALALFTLTSDAPQLVLYNRRGQRPMEFEVGCAGLADPARLPASLLDIRALTQWYNQRLEQVIRDAPDQYWWLHRRWKMGTF
mgnify:CR=1 FL=1